MFKCLIVDDEALARYAFRTFALRNSLQLEIVGEAETSFEAIEMFRNTLPDIVVMDIRIPGESGLETSKEMLNLKPETKIIVLTAYEDLDYMRQAFAVGVSGYLLKPLNKAEAKAKLHKIIEEIHNNKIQKQAERQRELQREAIVPYVQKELVNHLALGSFESKEIESYLRFLQLRLDAGYFVLFSFENDLEGKTRERGMNLPNLDKIEFFLEDHLSRFEKCLLGKSMGNVIVALFYEENLLNSAVSIQNAKMLADTLHRRIELNLHMETQIGIGNPYNGLDQLKTSFREAYNALKNTTPSEPVVHYANMQKESDCYLMSQKLIEEEAKFTECIRNGHIDKAKIRFHILLQQVFTQYSTIWEVQEYLVGFFGMMQRLLSSLNRSDSVLHHTVVIDSLRQLDSREDVRRWVELRMYSLLDSLIKDVHCKENSQIGFVRDIVDRKFCTDINLEIVASLIGLTPQYVSRMFKEEYGVNFVEYITKKRLDYAKELLKNKRIPLKEVSRAAGYIDTNYFCRLFKKHTGISPKQYQNRLGT